jgi:ABC-type thiamin/hydroxymethylpyrimidine transport system permease subunit
MKTGVIVGAISGGVVVAAMWALAGDFVRDVGMAGAAVWSQWLGSGEVVDRNPYLAYRWGALGSIVGLVVGAMVGAAFMIRRRQMRGWLVGAAAGIAGTIVSATVVVFTEGFGALAEVMVPPVVAVVFGLLVLGTITGALSDLVIRSLTSRGSAD